MPDPANEGQEPTPQEPAAAETLDDQDYGLEFDDPIAQALEKIQRSMESGSPLLDGLDDLDDEDQKGVLQEIAKTNKSLAELAAITRSQSATQSAERIFDSWAENASPLELEIAQELDVEVETGEEMASVLSLVAQQAKIMEARDEKLRGEISTELTEKLARQYGIPVKDDIAAPPVDEKDKEDLEKENYQSVLSRRLKGIRIPGM